MGKLYAKARAVPFNLQNLYAKPKPHHGSSWASDCRSFQPRDRPVGTVGRLPANLLIGDPDMQREQDKMTTWFDEHGYAADIGALRRIHPALLTLETWVRRNGWENAEPAPKSGGGWRAA